MKQWNRKFLVAVLLIAAMTFAFGCRTKVKDQPEPQPMPEVEDTVVTPPPQIEIEQPDDFVTEPEVDAVDLSGSAEQVTRRAHDLGWIRDVFFEFDSSALSADAQDALAVTSSWLRSNPGFNLLIEGHTDERGTQQYNLALGDRRANVARDYVVTLGVDPSRVRTISYGEERPSVVGSNESAWELNRRAHMVLSRN